MRTPRLGARAFIVPAVLAAAILFTAAPSTPASAAIASEGQQIAQIAKGKVGAPWRYGATGPWAFDCSGLVIYAYKKAGEGWAIRNGTLRSARSMYVFFKARGKTSRTNPKVGDLVIWGAGSHVGIYVGAGKAVSTLRSGVRVHGVFAVTAKFTTYIHLGMSARPVS
jgi:cell wall-associated NlpC family hydrolase